MGEDICYLCIRTATSFHPDRCVLPSSADIQQRLRAREELLAPIYKSIATELAALHDTPGRMLAKGVVR